MAASNAFNDSVEMVYFVCFYNFLLTDLIKKCITHHKADVDTAMTDSWSGPGYHRFARQQVGNLVLFFLGLLRCCLDPVLRSVSPS